MIPRLRPLRRLLAAAGLAAAAAATAHAQGVITNTASLSFQEAGVARVVLSNTTTLAVEAAPPQRRIEVLRLSNGGRVTAVRDATGGRCLAGDRWTAPPLPPSRASLDLTAVALQPAATVHVGEPLFVEAVLPDADRDPLARDRTEVEVRTSDGEYERLSLEETGEHTGRFLGYVGVASGRLHAPGDCLVAAQRAERLEVRLRPADASAAPAASVQVDPFGYVFDSQDGAPVNGARVTLVDDASGALAQVFGDDGSSSYPSTVVSGEDVVDASGRRYIQMPGEYRFPKPPPGRYRLRVEPRGGLVAPSRASPESLAALSAPGGEAFLLSDASLGGSFVVTDQREFHVDIPVDGRASALTLEKSTSSVVASSGDFVQYRLALSNPDRARPATGVRVVDQLPEGFRYVWGSLRLDGSAAPDPKPSPDGRSLTFPVGDIAPTAARRLSYLLALGPSVRPGRAVNRAQALGEAGLASNHAQASVRVRPAFYDDRITLVGRVAEGGCGRTGKGVADVRVLLQDGSFAVTDADGLYHFDDVRPGLQVVQLDAAALPPGWAPDACRGTTRRAGSDLSRFVDARDGVIGRADFRLRRTHVPGAAPVAPVVPDTLQEPDWFAGLQPGVRWLSPAPDHNPRAPAVKVVVAHAPGQTVELLVDGAPADPLAREGETLSADGRLAVTVWRGVALREGDTLLTARVSARDGTVAAELTRRVHYANRPARAEVLAARSVLAADGLTRPVLAVRITDPTGAPVRAGVMGTFRIAAPYAPLADARNSPERKADAADGAGGAWRVEGDDGVALIRLAPTTRAGELVVDLPLPADPAARPTQLRAWLRAERRDWVVVGFAAGTLGFDTLSRHVDPLNRRDPRPGFADGQLAFYAKGRIRGAWLLTIAYDNKRTADRDRGLMGGIDPDRNYTVYGDASQGGRDAQTPRKLYLRLERQDAYALFGDFQTGFADSELGRYERTLNGFRIERRGRRTSLAAFAAEADQTRVRDEIQGAGLSGPYRLSRRDLIVGAEQISIETRDRLRPERVLSIRRLSPRADYDLDYDTGLLTFTFPVLSRDPRGDPNIIVARYETAGGGRTVQAGARASVQAAGGRLAAGVTLLHDGQAAGGVAAELVAADVRLQVRPDTQLRLEAAVSDRDARGALSAQAAYVAEVSHRSGPADVLAYYRRQDAGFGLGQQAYGEAGAQKMGLDGRLRLPFGFSLAGSGRRETYAATGATRDAVDARLDWAGGDWALNVGIKLVRDDTRAGAGDSRLLTLGASRWLMDRRLQLTGSTDVALGGAAQSVDYPARRRLGAVLALSDTLRLTLDHDMSDGSAYAAQTTAGGVEWAPWKGARVTGGLGRQGLGGPALADADPRAFGRFGLSQSVLLGRRWTVDAAVDTTTTLAGGVPTARLLNPAFPSVPGGVTYGSAGVGAGRAGVLPEDFRAFSVGGAYRSDAWSWTGRGEARFGSLADTWNVSSAMLRRLGGGVALLAGGRASETRIAGGAQVLQGQAEASLAWRPPESRWSVLHRLEYRRDTAVGAPVDAVVRPASFAGPLGDADRVVGNLAVNYDTDDLHRRGGVQAGAFVGAKYVRGRFGEDAYAGLSGVVGATARLDLSERIDIGLQGAVRSAWAAGATNLAVGVSLGVSPAANTWVSVGWNLAGFRDRDFDAAAYTRQGPFVTARLKFDQQSLGGLRNLLGNRS